MKIAFRADASTLIGTGHIMRCLNLAEGMRERGSDVLFVCREHAGNLIPLIRRRAMRVAVLPGSTAPAGAIGNEDYATWLGAGEAEDAKSTIEVLACERPDWTVVDHYGIGSAWEKELRSRFGRLMVIDDLANRRHQCDLLLDQNYSQNSHRYSSLVPADCDLRLGPRYALLAPGYAKQRQAPRPRDGNVRRIFVFFGGSDARDMTGLALEALVALGMQSLSVDVVVGESYPHREKLASRLAAFSDVQVHDRLPTLVDLISRADIALGAGGTTTWERMCLGVPSVVIAIADNQRPACEALAAARMIEYAGHAGTASVQSVAGAVTRLVDSSQRLQVLSQNCKELVDGLGVSRLAALLDGVTTHE